METTKKENWKMKHIGHANWETAVAARDDQLAKECRLEFALGGWRRPIDAAEFLASPDADICLGLGDWDHIENGLGEWDWAELAARLRWRRWEPTGARIR